MVMIFIITPTDSIIACTGKARLSNETVFSPGASYFASMYSTVSQMRYL